MDFELFRTIATKPKRPEYSGCNTLYVRERGALKGTKTMAVNTPLVDMTPSDLIAIMTVMIEPKRITSTTGQKHMIFTCDQQLYKLLVDISCVCPEISQNFIARLGGNTSPQDFYR